MPECARLVTAEDHRFAGCLKRGRDAVAPQDLKPALLPPVVRTSAWRGNGRIHGLRSLPVPSDAAEAEEWLGSTVRQRGEESLSTLADGRHLADLVARDPVGWLGRAHVAEHGTDPTFIVKLVDAGQRLFLHAHPDRAFAHDHLASPYGKAEGWVILEADPGAVVHLGFSRDVGATELADWVATQDVTSMIEATNAVPVSPGDTVFCPGGLPHAIGKNILFAEVQEPTDLTVLLEWDGFPVNGAESGHLGLGFVLALRCVDRARWDFDRVTGLCGERIGLSNPPGVTRLLPPEADRYFTVERIEPVGACELPAAFSVLLVTDGDGAVEYRSKDRVTLKRGEAMVVPHAAGPQRLSGSMSVLRFTAAH